MKGGGIQAKAWPAQRPAVIELPGFCPSAAWREARTDSETERGHRARARENRYLFYIRTPVETRGRKVVQLKQTQAGFPGTGTPVRFPAMPGRPPDMAITTWQTRRKAGTQSRGKGDLPQRRLKLMRSPDIREARRPCSSGCRRCTICFASSPKGDARKVRRLKRAMRSRPPPIGGAPRAGPRHARSAAGDLCLRNRDQTMMKAQRHFSYWKLR